MTFWLGIREEFPTTCEMTLNIFLLYCVTYLYEMVLSIDDDKIKILMNSEDTKDVLQFSSIKHSAKISSLICKTAFLFNRW